MQEESLYVLISVPKYTCSMTYRVQPYEAFFGSQIKTGKFKSKMNSNSNSAHPVKAGWLNAILNVLKEQLYAEKWKCYKKNICTKINQLFFTQMPPRTMILRLFDSLATPFS